MDIFTTFDIAASGLKAQRTRLNTISSNLANVETTSTPEGGPYKKKSVLFQSAPVSSFDTQLQTQMNQHAEGVKVVKIIEDQEPPQKRYDPTHPDADKDGYISLPNISVMKEMVDMMSATRSYEANTTVIQSAKRMALKALEIGG
ncbi:MAG: flagellar basal body rod protein FlgC [Desulfobulbus propionicus]|nr:MAG: flagellar basal body rod protein FlgC [Desulfobulbus propionicus]